MLESFAQALMKIVYTSSAALPSRAAFSVNIVKMCDAFARNGHRVTLLMPRGEKSERIEQPLHAFYDVDRTFAVRRLPRPRIRGRRFIYAAAAAFVARRMRANLVFGRSRDACYACTLAGLPAVYDAHTVPENISRTTKFILYRLLGSRRLARLVTTTEALKKEYVRRFDVDVSKITVAPNGAADPTASEGKSTEAVDLKARDGRLQVGYVGHLYPGKGMEIIAPLARACPWADFHVVGGTEDDIERWKHWLNGAAHVTFHGFVPQRRAAQFRRAFDVLLAPYQRSVSTFGDDDPAAWMSPLKLFEYMAAGRPMICSDLPVLREVLTPGENAWLCPPDQPEKWKEALAHLRDHPGERMQLGRRARRCFEQHHTWTARAHKVLDGVTVD
jgi:glycosyltransferase involved in cell wall biosynthesis